MAREDGSGPDTVALRFEDALFRGKGKKGKPVIVDPPAPPLEAPIADTHTHLGLIDAPLALARCAAHNVDFLCCVTEVDEGAADDYAALDGWTAEALALLPVVAPAATRVPRVRLAVGCHPHNADGWTAASEAALRRLLADPRTCALGEVGLDYYYNLSSPEHQCEVFRLQIRLAHETGLPLILHIRDAHEEALAILDDEGFPPAGTLLHCCSLAPDQLAPWLKRGCYIAYGGALTFKRSEDVRAAVALVPANRLLTETDAPYMAPEPLRGTTCSPECTIFTAARLAAARGCTPGLERAALLAQIHENALQLLDRGLTPWQANVSRS